MKKLITLATFGSALIQLNCFGAIVNNSQICPLLTVVPTQPLCFSKTLRQEVCSSISPQEKVTAIVGCTVFGLATVCLASRNEDFRFPSRAKLIQVHLDQDPRKNIYAQNNLRRPANCRRSKCFPNLNRPHFKHQSN